MEKEFLSKYLLKWIELNKWILILMQWDQYNGGKEAIPLYKHPSQAQWERVYQAREFRPLFSHWFWLVDSSTTLLDFMGLTRSW